MPKKYKYCSWCGKKLEDTYLMVADNFLIVNWFDEVDGSDNVFCSEECILEQFGVEERDNKV
jgi:hypothetical protein